MREFNLAATLSSGQAFRWRPEGETWIGIIGRHWVKVRCADSTLSAETAVPVEDWDWLRDYFQLEVDLDQVLRSLPSDPHLRAAVGACRGLRLLRQDPWECLASFILSSTKQIVQIQQIIAALCERYGEPLSVPPAQPAAHAFPAPARLAETTEAGLRMCRMGFRAPYLLATARRIASGGFDLERLCQHELDEARVALMSLPGVGRKIADCVLLFAYGFSAAFPIDVWVAKALRRLYFPQRQVAAKQLHAFVANYFGPQAGYAQQYLFHYIRSRKGIPAPDEHDA